VTCSPGKIAFFPSLFPLDREWTSSFLKIPPPPNFCLFLPRRKCSFSSRKVPSSGLLLAARYSTLSISECPLYGVRVVFPPPANATLFILSADAHSLLALCLLFGSYLKSTDCFSRCDVFKAVLLFLPPWTAVNRLPSPRSLRENLQICFVSFLGKGYFYFPLFQTTEVLLFLTRRPVADSISLSSFGQWSSSVGTPPPCFPSGSRGLLLSSGLKCPGSDPPPSRPFPLSLQVFPEWYMWFFFCCKSYVDYPSFSDRNQ